MSKKANERKHGGAKKIGRNTKRVVNQAMSAYVKGKISFENYRRQS